MVTAKGKGSPSGPPVPSMPSAFGTSRLCVPVAATFSPKRSEEDLVEGEGYVLCFFLVHSQSRGSSCFLHLLLIELTVLFYSF